MSTNCNEQEGICEVGMTECNVHGEHHHECCPFKSMIDKLNEAFCDATHEVYVDILKEKIHKAWGTQIEKAAEAVFAAKSTDWMAELSKAKAHHDLKDQIKKILSEGKK
ncbi:MAG: hypothetical protein HQK49_15395 [Oligoflexia bacterium]|nr:hypothetical protein [Oligoflexia bacterium]